MGNYDFELDLDTRNTMSVINQWIRPESEILEFGPANGRLTRYLSEVKKCRVTIVEINEAAGKNALKYAKKSFLGSENGDIEKFYWTATEDKYDYIIFADVLEHLNNPRKVLIGCSSLLKDQGRILVSIPNIAHNSIVIDMLNDNFEYSETGLLDRTHVHFFTLTSFQNMLRECFLYINDVVPIYSRVSNNEIDNSYQNVPSEVEKYLRKRVPGSIYQYVFNLSANKEDEEDVQVQGLEIEASVEFETQCFYQTDKEIGFEDAKRVSLTYKENQKVCFEMELGEVGKIGKLRWDPLENNGVVKVEQCIITNAGNVYPLEPKRTNAYCKCGEILIFETEDPWVEFDEIPSEMQNGRLQIIFSILEYRKNQAFYRELVQFLKSAGAKIETIYTEESQDDYIAHLESDLGEQKGYIEHLEKDLEEQKYYIAHLEKDIAELKAHIEKKRIK